MTHAVTATLGFADFAQTFRDPCQARDCARWLQCNGWLEVVVREVA